MFSATKFVVAGVIVALFGGFLLSGVLTQPSDDPLPAAVSSASTEPDASEVAAPTTEATNAPESVTTTDPLPGTFSPAGSLGEARLRHAATLLPDGRVLVVGGVNDASNTEGLASAEIWDPATASFEPTGSLAEGGLGPTSTLLPDGRVLVVGGDFYWPDPGEVPAKAEIWDPATASFSPAGSPAGRTGHTATGLPDGRVLLVGGKWRDSVRKALDSPTEIWDPATVSFGPAGSLARTRDSHTATLLPDGRVLVVGGNATSPGSGDSLSSAEIWDPVTGSFGPAGSLANARWGHTATLLPDGRVLVVGGYDNPDRNGSDWKKVRMAEAWDPVTASFSPAGSLSRARVDHTATLLPDGRVLVVGGSVKAFRRNLAEIWDPATASFSKAGSPAEARSRHTASLLPDGRVLVVGGSRDAGPVATAEIWNP